MSASSTHSSALAKSAHQWYDDAWALDAASLLESVNTYLPLAFYYHDEDSIAFYLRRLLHVHGMKQTQIITKKVKEEWIKLLMTQLLAKGPTINIQIQIKMMSILSRLFQFEKEYDLAFDWKELYEYLAQYHLNDSTRSVSIFSSEAMHSHQRALVKLIAHCRRYFISSPTTPSGAPGSVQCASVGEEILNTFIPFLSPFDNKYFASQALICLFFPSTIRQKLASTAAPNSLPAASISSYHRLFKLYTPFTANLIEMCPMTIKLNVELYSRLAKHGLGVLTGEGKEILAPFVTKQMSTLFSSFLQTLELDIGGKSSQNRHRNWGSYSELVSGSKSQTILSEIADHFAKYVAYTLHYGQNAKSEADKKTSTQTLLTSLLYTLRTYVHPSHTSGHQWHDAIGTFLFMVTRHYCKRLGREIRGEAVYDKKYFLDPNNYDFVLAIQPIALQGLHSKSPNMIHHCEMTLKHLATFFPSLILPGLVTSIEQSLVDVNASHRMMSSLQVLTSMANIAFNSELNIGTAGGSGYLINLMNLSLPGIDIIDPLKSTYTLTWLAILFYLVPFVDARDTGGSNEQQVDLPNGSKLPAHQRYSLTASNPTAEGFAEAVELARTSTMQFEEWSLNYVDQLIKLLGSTDKFAKKDWADQAFARLLYKNSRAFFAALSPKIFNQVSAKFVKIILGEHHPTSQKQWGILVHTMSLAQTETFIKSFVPALLKKLIVEDVLASLAPSELEWYLHLLGQAVKQGGGATACADAQAAGMNGNLLLPYVTPIQQVYQLTYQHDTKGVRKCSRKMLRNLLKGLTFTYPAEWRNFSPIDDWSQVTSNGKNKSAWTHWKQWGTYTPKAEPYGGFPSIDLIWHVPSAEEMAAAESIVAAALKQPLSWLTDWMDGVIQEVEEQKDAAVVGAASALGKGDTPLERHLQTVISLVRGVQQVMGGIEGEEYSAPFDEDDHDQSYTKSGRDLGARCPKLPVKLVQPVKPLGGVIGQLLSIGSKSMKSLPPLTSLRSYLVRLTHHAFERARALAVGPIFSQPSTKSTVLLVKLSQQALDQYGLNERNLSQDTSGGRYSRARLRDLLSGIRSRIRPQLVQKCYDYHHVLMVELSYNETYTADVRALLMDLHQAATNDFTKIRSKSTSLLIASLRRFPQAIDMTIDAMLDVFSNPTGKTSDESLLGCMGVLVDQSMCNWIARKWSRMNKFITTFFRYGQHTSNDDKVQMLVQQLFNSLFPHFQMRTVQLPLIDAGAIPASLKSLIDSSKVARRNQSITRYNKQLSRTYLELMTFLHNFASGQVSTVATTTETKDQKLTHWRYSLMSSAFFLSLSRQHHYSAALSAVDSTDGYITWHHYITFFLKGAISTLAPLRLISFFAILKFLGTQSLSMRKELNRIAANAIGSDVAQVLASMDAGQTTPVDPAASLSKSGSILSFTSIDSDKEMLDTIFYDYLYSGWMGDVYNTVVCKYKPNTSGRFRHYHAFSYFTPLSLATPLKFPFKPQSDTILSPVTELPPATLSAIFEFFTFNSSKNLQSLIDHFVYNHPTLAPTIEGQANERAGDGAGDQIATLALRGVSRGRKMFPVTRFNTKSAAFNMIHVNIIRGLVESFPQIITESTNESGLLKMIIDLTKATEEPDKSCTAAEILCGIITAMKHFTIATQLTLQKSVLPLLSQALQTVQPDCLDHWGDALRHIYTNQDPRRLAWLTRALFLDALNELPSANFIQENLANTQINPKILDPLSESAVGSPPSPSAGIASKNVELNANVSPSIQFKRLRFFLSVLTEVGFRGTKLGEWIITTFKKKGFLYHPYKQVREEISWILFLLCRNEFQLYENHPAQSPGGRISEPAATLSVISSPVYLQFLNYIRVQFDQVKLLYRAVKSNPTPSPTADGSPAALDASEKHIDQQKDRAKHFIETVLTWFHATLVCGDMVFTSIFYQTFLPYVLWAQHHPDPEIGAIARFAGSGAAWINAGGQALAPITSDEVAPAQGVATLHDAEALPLVQALSLTDPSPKRAPLDSPSLVIDNILSNLRATILAPENTWHVRVAVARFLQIWLPRHSLALNAQQLQVVETLLLEHLLVDQQIEVREAASQAFQSFVASSFPLILPTKQSLAARADELRENGEEEPTGTIVRVPHPHIGVLSDRLQKLVLSTSGGKKNANSSKTLDGLTLAQRHGGLLGLSGLVLTHPYDLPAHVPALLSFIGVYVEDRNQSVSGSLRKFFASFTSSHKDEWETFSRMFTEEQLEELQSMQLAPSYFA